MAAFEQLVRRYEERIFRFLIQRCGNHEDAQEITQDTFVKAFHAMAGYNPRQVFAPWLFTIARHKCIDRLRSRGRTPDGALPEEAEMNMADPAALISKAEEKDEIWRLAKKHLPAGQYEALWLRYVEDMNIEEVSRVLRKTKTHVKILLFRGRKTLARHLDGRTPATAARSTAALAPATELQRTLV